LEKNEIVPFGGEEKSRVRHDEMRKGALKYTEGNSSGEGKIEIGLVVEDGGVG